jgi:hypothetical protein
MHTDSESQTLDPSLFELASTHYIVGNRPSTRYASAPTAAQNRIALSTLLQSGELDKALKTLRELQALQAEIQPYALFAEAALKTARQGDHDGALRLLKLVPPASSLAVSKTKGATKAYIRPLLCDLLHQFQQLGQVEPLWQALLIIANLGYVKVGQEGVGILERFSGPIQWLMRQDCYSSSWQIAFWRHFLSQVAWSQAGGAERARLSSKGHVGPFAYHFRLGMSVRMVLRNCFNAIVRSFMLAGRLDVALSWAEMDAVFGKQSASFLPAVHVIWGQTWNSLLHAIFDDRAAVDEEVCEKAVQLHQSLIDQMCTAEVRGPHTGEDGEGKSVRNRVRRLARDGKAILGGRSTGKEQDYFRAFADKTTTMLDAGQYAELAAELNDALDEKDFFPDAATLARINEHGDNEHLSLYFERLKARTALQPQLLRASMMWLNDTGEHLKALQQYFYRTNDRFFTHLARLVLHPEEQAIVWPESTDTSATLSDTRPKADSLVARNFLNTIALQSLLAHLRRDPDRLQTLYTAWRAGVSPFDRTETSSPNVTHADGSSADLAPFAPHRDHFVGFLRSLPAAYTLRARRQPDSSHATADAIELAAQSRHQAKIWTMTIAQDANTFQARLQIDMINLMLNHFIRNLDAYGEDYEDDLTRIQTLLDSVGVQAARKVTSTASKDDPLPDAAPPPSELDSSAHLQATPLTYAYVIRAYLSVQADRGGPMLDQAKAIYEAFRLDQRCQRAMRNTPLRYEKVVKHAENALHDIQLDVERQAQRNAWQGAKTIDDEDVQFT